MVINNSETKEKKENKDDTKVRGSEGNRREEGTMGRYWMRGKGREGKTKVAIKLLGDKIVKKHEER